MDTYNIARDGIADLALPLELEDALYDATDEQKEQVEDRVNAELAASGWHGEWSSEEIVRDVLASAVSR